MLGGSAQAVCTPPRLTVGRPYMPRPAPAPPSRPVGGVQIRTSRPKSPGGEVGSGRGSGPFAELSTGRFVNNRSQSGRGGRTAWVPPTAHASGVKSAPSSPGSTGTPGAVSRSHSLTPSVPEICARRAGSNISSRGPDRLARIDLPTPGCNRSPAPALAQSPTHSVWSWPKNAP